MIETERLLLRRFTPDDLDELAAIFANEEVWWFPLRRGMSRDETAKMLQERFIDPWSTLGYAHWAVIRKEDSTMLGYCGLAIPTFLPEVLPAVEVGYRLDPEAWNKGYATEAARASLTYGFDELGLDRIIAIYDVENIASGKVMQRMGMRVERETIHPGDGSKLRVYEITRAEWPT